MFIADLADHEDVLPTLARWHFDQWGPLTGASSLEAYTELLETASKTRTVPSVLVAFADGALIGSATLLASDLPVRPALTPWLAQLFVAPGRRRDGVGAALVTAVRERARRCGYARLYLFTSGTLPDYYARLGWGTMERVAYLGRERTVMDIAL